MENSFGNYIFSKRIAKNLTLTELASELDLDVLTLSKIERNFREFPRVKLQRLANIFNVSFEDVIIEFLRSDLYNSYGEFPDIKKLVLKALEGSEEPHTLKTLIAEGESKKVEFKSSLRYCLKTLKPEKYVEYNTIKNICAFLNSEGGKLIIGLSDNKEILGLETLDFLTFKESDKNDAWLKHFDNLLSKYFGNGISNLIMISFETIENKTLACIDVLPNRISPTFIKNPEKENNEDFYVRRNASAIYLTMNEFYQYSKERW